MKKVTALLAIAVVFSLCDQRIMPSEIKRRVWKYHKGYYLGDYLNFQENGIFRIDNDFCVFKRDKKVAAVKSCSDEELILISADSNKSIAYYLFFSELAN